MLALFAVRGVYSFAGWLLTVLIARFLGLEQYGGYAFAFSFAGLFVIVSDLGLNSFLIRELSAGNTHGPSILSSALVTKPMLAVGAFVIIAAAINLLHYPSSIQTLVYLLGAQLVLRSLAGLFVAVIHARQEMRLETKAESIGRFAGVGLGFCALISGLGLAAVAWGLLLGELLRFLYLYSVTRKHLMFHASEISYRSCRSLLLSAFPFGFFALMMSFNYKADSVLLSFFHDQVAVGTYHAAYHLVLASLLVPSVVAGALYPSFSATAATESRDGLAFPLRATFRLMLLLGAAASIVTYAWANDIIEFLYTSSYAESGPCLRILSWSMVLMFPQYVLGAAMLAVRRERSQLLVWVVAVGLNLLFNVLFIPRFGPIAASVITVSTEALVLVLFYAVMRSELTESIAGVGLWRLIGPIVSTFVGGLALARSSVTMPFGILLTGAILVASVIAFRTISREEMTRYKRLFSLDRKSP